jgi:hypothetical protein
MNTDEVESQVEESSAPVQEASEPQTPAGVDNAPAAVATPTSGGAGSVYDAFRSLPQFQGHDDRSIASRLYEALQREQSATEALQQYQSVIPYASEYLSNKPLFEEWLRVRSQPQAAPQVAPQQQKAEENPWWNPPKIRDAYTQYLVRDENGREVIDPNAPLDAKHALSELLSYKADFAKKFLTDPQATLGPMVERVAQQEAAEIVQGQIERMQQEQFVSNLEKENADWLFDQNGNVSREGLAVQKYVEDAKALGISGAEARWQYAVSMVERDLLALSQQQLQRAPVPAAPAAPAPSQQESLAQRNMEYLRQQASRTPSQSTSTTTDQRVPKPAMNFAQRLAQQLSADGLSS